MKKTISIKQENFSKEKDIYLKHILQIIFDKNKFILMCIFISLILSSFYLHITKYYYKSEIKLYPTQSSSSGVGKQLSSLSSITGINISSDQRGSAFDIFPEEIYTLEIADKLSSDSEIMKDIFKNEWDSKKSTWKRPDDVLSILRRLFGSLLGLPNLQWSPPNGMRLQDYIQRHVFIEEKLKKPLMTISYENEDPKFAVKFLSKLYKETDDILRQRALDRSEKYISYLSKKLDTVTVSEYRSSLITILSDQEKQNMIASSSAPYSVEPIGDATASLNPTAPKPILVLSIGFFIGLFGSIIFILARTNLTYER